MLTPVTLFIVIGISIDDVFVFVDTYRAVELAGLRGRERMWATFTNAAMATFLTTLTSACAFASNCVSVVAALADFGLFTALVCVESAHDARATPHLYFTSLLAVPRRLRCERTAKLATSVVLP